MFVFVFVFVFVLVFGGEIEVWQCLGCWIVKLLKFGGVLAFA